MTLGNMRVMECARSPRGVSYGELAGAMKKAGRDRTCPAFSWEDVLMTSTRPDGVP